MKKIVILFGPPGAGKGTQAELLADKTGYYHLESSKVIEHCFNTENPEKVFEIEGKSYKVADEKEIWLSGKLNNPPFVVNLLVEKIKELAEQEKSIIFSGSPRTVYEADIEAPLLIKLYGLENITFFMLDIKPETTIHRNSNRRICELVRHSILFTKETEHLTLCPLDGSKLVRRGLDDPKVITKRLEEFKERTYPIAADIEKQGIKVHKINGEPSVAQVHENIMSFIEQ
jgi:adenylate kinase